MTFLEKVRAARGKIEALKNELATIDAQTRSRAEVEAILSERIDSFAVEGRAQRQRALDRISRGIPAGLFHVRATGATDSGDSVNVTLDMGPILTQLLGEGVMLKALRSAISGLPAGLAPDAKKKRRNAILADMDAAHKDEESAIRDAEAIEETIPRRLDADPRYVLSLNLDDAA